MSVNKKTYFSPVGNTSFYDPALALGVIYSFSQQGQNDYIQDPWDEFSDPLPGHFMYNVANGHMRVNPGTPFLPGFLTVIYKAVGIPVPPPPEPPPFCELPGVPVISLVGVNTIRVTMPAIGDYIVELIPAAGSCGDVPVRSMVIYSGTITNFPDQTDGTYKVCARRMCGGELYSGRVVSNTINIAPPPINFGARKVPADTAIKILSISAVPFITRSGSYPLVTASQTILGRHEGFTPRQIIVKITVNKKQQVVVALYKNTALVQFIVVYLANAGSTFVTFNPISATPTDDIFVALDYT